MDSKRVKHRSSSTRSVEDSKVAAKSSPPPRRGSVCQNQAAWRIVHCAGKEESSPEAEPFPAFIPSQTFEQRNYGASAAALLKNDLNPIEIYKLPNETRVAYENERSSYMQTKPFGDPCCRQDMSERPTCSTDVKQCAFDDGATATGDSAAVVNNSCKTFRREMPTGPMNTGDNVSIDESVMSNADRNETFVRIAPTMDPDDTYARVCSLGQPLPWPERFDCSPFTAEKSTSGAASVAPTENSDFIEDEGWNPLFYEPVLVLCPKNENSELSSSESGERESKTTLCQQLQNWLAQGQANYIQKQKALEAAKLEAAEKLKKQQQQQTQQQQEQQQQEPKQQYQQQQQQQYQQQQLNSINQNLRYEQEFQMYSSRNLYAPLAAPIAETRSTWSTQASSWGVPNSMNSEKPQSIPSTMPSSEGPYRGFGTFKAPIPTPTSTAFPDPYLWSVDSSNPFWIRDQRPSFANVNDDDPFGLNSLPPKPKKKESTELVDAIKAGVGLLGPSPLEIYYANLRAGRPTTYEFDAPNMQAKTMPKTIDEQATAGCSMEHTEYIKQRFQQTWLKHNGEGASFIGGGGGAKMKNVMPYEAENSAKSELDFQQSTQQDTHLSSKDKHPSHWTDKRLINNFNIPFCTTLEKESKSHAESTSLGLPSNLTEDSTAYDTLSRNSMETISVEVLMNESFNTANVVFESAVANDSDSDSDEFLSGIAEDDADFGEDSFKSCLQFPYDSSESWKDSRSGSSLENTKNEEQSGISSASDSKLAQTKCVERYNQLVSQDSVLTPIQSSPTKETTYNETKTATVRPKNKRTERFYTQVKVRSIGFSNFDLQATRLKLDKFNLYVEPKGLNAMERLKGFDYTVEAIQELLKYRANNRPSVRGIISVSQKLKIDEQRSKNSPDSDDRKFRYYQKARGSNGKPSIRAHSQLQNKYTDEASGTTRSNVPRFNPHWKSSKMRAIRQQQQQQQRLQLQQMQQKQQQMQRQQQPSTHQQQQPEQQQQLQEQQGFNEFPYQRTTVFTNSFHRNYHTKRVYRKPSANKSIMLQSNELLQQQQNNPQQQQQQQQQQPKGPTDSKLFETPFDLVPPSEPVNTRPMLFENNATSKDKHSIHIPERVAQTDDSIQIPAKK